MNSHILRICKIRNHRKHQEVHSGIVSGRQGPEQARTLARRQTKKDLQTPIIHRSFSS